MFIMYMTFCEVMAMNYKNPTVGILLMFLEFLAFNGLQIASIMNYVSAIKYHFKWFDLCTDPFEHHKVKAMLRALKNTSTKAPKFKGVFDLQTLLNIVTTANLLPHSEVFIALYLLAFFAFFRISNLLPVSKHTFDWKKHLCRGDVIFRDVDAIIVIKWSKTIRTISAGTYVLIPRIPGHPLCPVSALQRMCALHNLPTNAPLFILPSGLLTQTQARSHLAKCLHILNLDSCTLYTFHTFCRSGAILWPLIIMHTSKISRDRALGPVMR